MEKEPKLLNCKMLAYYTGRTPGSIKNIAKIIPGADKSLGVWTFPKSAIAFVLARKPGAPEGPRNGRWNGNK